MNKVVLHTNNQIYVIEIEDNQIIKSYPDELHINININDINALISYLQTIRKDSI